MLPYLFLMIGCILLDQLTKILARVYLSGISTVPLIPGVLHLTFSQNTGAAFSLFTGWNTALLIFSALIIAGFGFALYSLPKHRGFRNLILAVTLMMGGAIGNFIDRLFAGAVTDFIDFRLIGFPIFNVADICVVAGAILAVLYFIRSYIKVPRMTDIRKSGSLSGSSETKPSDDPKVLSTIKKHRDQSHPGKGKIVSRHQSANARPPRKTPQAKHTPNKKDNRIKWNPPTKPE